MKVQFNKRSTQLVLCASTAALLSACGGGSGTDSTQTINPTHPVAIAVQTSGVAATGNPITSGAITLKCASGATATAVTGSDGSYLMNMKDTDYPCVVQVSGGSANGRALTGNLYSVAATSGKANITPLTDLMVSAVAGISPNDFYNTATPTSLTSAITGDKLNVALTKLKATIAQLPGQLTISSNFNTVTGQFSAAKGDAQDALLDQYATALTAAGLTQADVVTKVSSGAAITKQAFSAKAFTTPNLTTFNIGASINLDNTFGIAITDPNRGAYTAKALIDTTGNVTSFTDAGQLTGVISTLGNRAGMFCANNQGTSQGQYVFVSSDMVEVTEPSELNGKTFHEYVDCATKNTATFDAQGTVRYSNGETDTGIAASFTAAGLTMDGSTVRSKAYKYTAKGVTSYVYLSVASKVGSQAAAINGQTDYVVIGVQLPVQ